MFSRPISIRKSILLGSIFLVLLTHHQSNPSGVPDFYQLNQLYQSGQYQKALDSFYQLLKIQPGLLQKEPVLRFKIGYAHFQLGNSLQAVEIFQNSLPHLKIIEDYLLYFQALCYLKLEDTLTYSLKSKSIRDQFPGSSLIPLLDSIQARLAIDKQQSDSAIQYLNAMLKSNYFDRDEIYLDLLSMYHLKADTGEYHRLAFQFLAAYPFHDRSEIIYKQLLSTYPGKIPLGDLKKLLAYLFETKQLLTAEKLLQQQSIWSDGVYEQEYFRWMPVEILYRHGEYQKVLEWCQSNRASFKNLSILREIDLNTARCQLRLDRVSAAITSYLQFQERYPRDVLAPEVLWKVAWLYEERKNIPAAIQMYRKVVNHYPRYEFYSEAYFRIGLNYYRLKKISGCSFCLGRSSR